jgi:DNA-binding response OmpR family regulator
VTRRRSLDDHLVDTFVGRTTELAELERCLDPAGPVVTFVQGIPGVGTTALLERFAIDARRRGSRVVALDGRTIEPTPAAVLAALRSSGLDVEVASGGDGSRSTAPAEEPEPRTVLLVDHWSSIGRLDVWFRQELVPNLPSAVFVIATDRPPGPAWRAVPEPDATVRLLHLDVLPAADAGELLARLGVTGEHAARIVERTRGLPLALHAAASAATETRPTSGPGDAIAEVAAAWSEAHLASLRPDLRQAVEVIAVARRGTLALLTATVAEAGPALMDELAALPFVRTEEDGLAVHPAVRPAIVAGLRAMDPDRSLAYRRAAWELVRPSLGTGSPTTSWRPIADLLHLIDHPLLHEAVFPFAGPRPDVGPAAEPDLAQVAAIAGAHLPSTSSAALVAAARAGVGQLRVSRAGMEQVAGFMSLLDRASLASRPLADEPTVAAVRAHLRRHPLPGNQDVLVVPAPMSVHSGERRDEHTAALWIDLNRTYLERRERLRRVYAIVTNLPGFLAAGGTIGFEAAVSPVVVDGVARHVAVLDLGPAGVEGWLAKLADSQRGPRGPALELDPTERTVRIEDREVVLSRLEFGVLELLVAREGRPTSRSELIRAVWGHDYTGGSNVVDAVVRTLRRKLGEGGDLVQTVRGVGYRLAGPPAAASHDAEATPV